MVNNKKTVQLQKIYKELHLYKVDMVYLVLPSIVRVRI